MYQKLFYTDFTNKLCSDENMVEYMLEIELALVEAQAANGIIPKASEEIISSLFQNIKIDIEKLKEKIPLSGNAAAPLVKQIIEIIKKENPEASKYIHLGATSQDIVDTALILKIKKYSDWLSEKINALEYILNQLSLKFRHTVMIGRTLTQQARPITFGLKTAKWLQGIRNAKQLIKSIEGQLFVIQLGGAVGSQNQYLTNEVRQSFAQILGLKNTPSWHTQRENIAAFASALGVMTGSLGKIAKDILLLSQTEVGEVLEPIVEGRGTSSTMPQKRNPILSTAILANAHRVPFLVASILAAMPQAHERSAGLWHSGWETLDDIMGLTAGALEKAIEVLDGLQVNEKRMRQNIELTKGLVFAETIALALAEKMGKQEAYDLIKEACKKTIVQGIHLREILENMDLNFSENKLNELFEPKNAIGQSLEIIDEILSKK